MKTFVKENWYKLMIGSSMFVFSVSALIYSVSPARADYSVSPARAENVFKAKSNGDSDYIYLVDSQDRVWVHKINGTNTNFWYLADKTLK